MAPSLVVTVETTDSSSTDVSSSVADSSTVDDSTDASSTTSSSSSQAAETEAPTAPALSDSPTSALERAGVLEGIIGKDNQYKVTNTTADPYRKVVRLEMEFADGSYVGSGVMISRDTILTAAHNVYDADNKRWATSVTAYPAKNGSSNPYGSYKASNYYILRRYKSLNGDSNYDTAVIKLSKQVDSRVGYLSVSTSQSLNQKIQVPGYPAATYSKSGYMYTMFGNITEIDGSLMGYTIDTEGGQSGSGVLNSNNQVIGVHILGLKSGGQYVINAARRVQADTLSLINIAQNNKATTIDVTSYKETKTNTTYRLYNASIKRHLYTQNLDEASVLTTRGWSFEGAKFKTASSGTPVYRLYSSVTKEHVYTTSTTERDTLVKRGWRNEGIAWYSSGKNPVYRLYNSALKVHLYTTDKNEVNTLVKRGWKNEGIAWYTL